jgi:hypothetical protein
MHHSSIEVQMPRELSARHRHQRDDATSRYGDREQALDVRGCRLNCGDKDGWRPGIGGIVQPRSCGAVVTARRELLCRDAKLIVLTRLHDVPLSRIAAEWGYEEQTLRARRRRAEAHLSATMW